MQIASKMKLKPGFESEYRKRHDALWPDLKELLLSRGIDRYSIFLDPETNILFAILTIDDPDNLSTLPGQEIMKKWWQYMKDIMDTHADGSPVATPLSEMFYLEK